MAETTLSPSEFRRYMAASTARLPELGCHGLRQPGTPDDVHAQHRAAMQDSAFLERVDAALTGLARVAYPRRGGFRNRAIPLAVWVALVERAAGRTLGAGPVLAAACMRGFKVYPSPSGSNACLSAGLAEGIVMGDPGTYPTPAATEQGAAHE